MAGPHDEVLSDPVSALRATVVFGGRHEAMAEAGIVLRWIVDLIIADLLGAVIVLAVRTAGRAHERSMEQTRAGGKWGEGEGIEDWRVGD